MCLFVGCVCVRVLVVCVCVLVVCVCVLVVCVGCVSVCVGYVCVGCWLCVLVVGCWLLVVVVVRTICNAQVSVHLCAQVQLIKKASTIVLASSAGLSSRNPLRL